jgi:hypothetical protein
MTIAAGSAICQKGSPVKPWKVSLPSPPVSSAALQELTRPYGQSDLADADCVVTIGATERR